MPLRLLLSACALAVAASAQNMPVETTKATLDVGIIVTDIDRAQAFYGGVLGLSKQSSLPMPDGTTMYRYQNGTSTIKLRAFPKAPKYTADLRGAVGIRVVSLFTYDLDGIVKRYTASGAAPPRVVPFGNAGIKLGFIDDPDGNEFELIGLAAPASGTPAPLDRMQIGLTVSNVEASREFYGKVLGLKEEKAQAQALLDGNLEYVFDAGRTQIKFWIGSGANIPKHTGEITDAIGIRYFTFSVKDVDAAYKELKSRGAKFAMEPTDFGTLARIMMVSDPDGNWVEFAAPRAR